MHIVTCQVGGSLRLGEEASIVVHGRQGAQIALGAVGVAGMGLVLSGPAPVAAAHLGLPSTGRRGTPCWS